MPKMIVGRRLEYFETYEIDTDKLASVRDDLDLCQRILWSADPVFVQQICSCTEEGRSAVKFLSKKFDRISENPIYPVPDCYLPKDKKE